MTGLSSSVILTLSQAPPGSEVRMLARELPQHHWGTWRMGFPKSTTDRIRKATVVQRKLQSQLECLLTKARSCISPTYESKRHFTILTYPYPYGLDHLKIKTKRGIMPQGNDTGEFQMSNLTGNQVKAVALTSQC